ncbi:MAG: sugar transporter substrate-binding protein [Bacilli bacterium]|nr:sugar transporter substrate-binding protein [Bacilli bacterium]
MFKKGSALLMVSALVVVLSACGGAATTVSTSSPDAGTAATVAPKATDAPAAKQTVIKMIGWKQQAENDWITDFNKKFEAAHPEYKIDYTISLPDDPYKQLQLTRMNANDVDIMPHLSSFILGPKDYTPGADTPPWLDFINSGKILDITGQAFVKNYRANDILKGTTINGKVYGIPTGSVAIDGLFYNKDIFAKYNLKVPTTWTEFLAVLKTLKDKGQAPLGVAGKDLWPLHLLTQGLEASILDDQDKFVEGMWKGTAKFTDPQPVEVLAKEKILMDNYVLDGFMGVDYASLPTLFTSGKVAMIADGSWDAPVYEKAGMHYGYFPVPGNEDPKKNTDLAGKYDLTFMIGAKGPNTAGALKWLEEFSKPENYAGWVKAAGFEATQDNIVASPFSTEIAPYLKGFKLAYEQIFINKPNEGEHIKNADQHAEFLAPGGPIKSAQDLAVIQQKEWEAAK